MARPTMMLELFPVEVRYLTEVAALAIWTSSTVLITPVVYLLQDISWRYLYLIFTLTSAYSVFGYWICDESVRWLLANGKTSEAKNILRKAAKINKVNKDEVLFIVEKVKAEYFTRTEDLDTTTMIPTGNDVKEINKNNLPKYNILTLFKKRRISTITVIMIIAWTVDSLTYYGLILSSASLPVDRYLSFFLLAVAEYPVAIFEYTLMNRIGRKRFCILFHAVAAVSLLAGTAANYLSDFPGANIAIMAFFFLGKLGITGSFSCLFLYTPEMYPTNLRTIGIGLASAAGRVGGMLAPFAGPLSTHVRWAPGAIFGCLCVILTLVLPFLPETRGHELPTLVEELEEWYKTHSGTNRRQQSV
ncbi:organic cation/carnitine transporter 2-like [Ylistrum balloti]|uniref:organic cation/carnitine transporter 2-like n=1 Tax=Ylistrum balloti TaxID=509963 RepID=UPI002905E858|nr:organic cation/carnitine transporter 2-like [Ylistrum balloti]